MNSCAKSIEDSLELRIALVNHSLKTKKEYKNLKKQEMSHIFIKTILINPAFCMTWLIKIT